MIEYTYEKSQKGKSHYHPNITNVKVCLFKFEGLSRQYELGTENIQHCTWHPLQWRTDGENIKKN